MTEQSQATYSGWAVVELFGHSREAGFVTTQYFGSACLFQVDIPELPEREETLKRPDWNDDGTKLLPVGTVIRREAVPGRTRLIGPGAVYAMNPATEQAVRAALENGMRRKFAVVSMPEVPQLEAPDSEEAEEEDDFEPDDGGDYPI